MPLAVEQSVRKLTPDTRLLRMPGTYTDMEQLKPYKTAADKTPAQDKTADKKPGTVPMAIGWGAARASSKPQSFAPHASAKASAKGSGSAAPYTSECVRV